MRTQLLLLLAMLGWFASSAQITASAADAPSSGTELKRQQEEVNRLKQELDQAQGELKRLQQENKRLREERTHPPRATGAAPAKPVKPIGSLPALLPAEVVEVDELVAQFANEPAAAAQRYGGKVFRIRGTVARFQTKLVIRAYDVVLETPSRDFTLRCGFNYMDKYQAVYTTHNGRSLTARPSGYGERELLKIGAPLVVQGRCRGLKDGDLVFSGCEVIR